MLYPNKKTQFFYFVPNGLMFIAVGVFDFLKTNIRVNIIENLPQWLFFLELGMVNILSKAS